MTSAVATSPSRGWGTRPPVPDSGFQVPGSVVPVPRCAIPRPPFPLPQSRVSVRVRVPRSSYGAAWDLDVRSPNPDPATSNPGTSNPGTSNPGTSNPGTSYPGTWNLEPGTWNLQLGAQVGADPQQVREDSTRGHRRSGAGTLYHKWVLVIPAGDELHDVIGQVDIGERVRAFELHQADGGAAGRGVERGDVAEDALGGPSGFQPR